jgi:Tyrosine phosphatase family
VFLDLTPGRLALTHRPKKAALATWRALGVTHVMTLLLEREGARDVGALTAAEGLAWIWCPLNGGDVTTRFEAVAAGLEAGRAALATAGSVVVHCSAGIHRTGMVGYALLRCVGLDAVAARAKLHALRAVTAEGVGAARLAWGDQIAARFTAST